MRLQNLAMVLMAVVLVGCIGGKRAPDETRVVAGPKLMLPPEFGLLPPTDGVATPAERAANEKIDAAQSALLGGSDNMPMVRESASSAQFLLEGREIDPNIRQVLTEEQEAIDKAKQEGGGFFNRLRGNGVGQE